jgi:hypothetical protein
LFVLNIGAGYDFTIFISMDWIDGVILDIPHTSPTV